MTTKETVLETFTCENISLLKQGPKAKKDELPKASFGSALQFLSPTWVLRAASISVTESLRRALQENVVTLELYYMEVSSF
jgi:hypothetical protein